ncbi:VWA domain-containing protein [Cryomorpha ignava]|nr:VWA domain-containing protein [Cryomorpha ignava]
MEKRARYNLFGMMITAIALEIMFWSAFLVIYFVLSKALPGLRWEKPDLAWLFLTGPLMFVVFTITSINKNYRLRRFGDPVLLFSLLPNISSVNASIKYILWRLAAGFLVMALINPQLGSKMSEAKVRGIDIMLAVDVSNSMMAEDLKPNRLTLATRSIEKLLEKLHGDRIGIVVFAGQAFVQLPITNDYSAGKLFLSSISPNIVPVQGTAIGAAIDLSLESFDFETPAQKVIIVITDGENHEDDPLASAKAASDKGVKVYTIGMGSTDGTPIPNYDRGRKDGFLKDREGTIVMSRLNEEMLEDIADAGNGSYIRASNAEVGLKPLLAELNSIEKTEMGSVSYSEYEDRFQLFLALALAFLLLEFFIRERKGKIAREVNLFD